MCIRDSPCSVLEKQAREGTRTWHLRSDTAGAKRPAKYQLSWLGEMSKNKSFIRERQHSCRLVIETQHTRKQIEQVQRVQGFLQYKRQYEEDTATPSRPLDHLRFRLLRLGWRDQLRVRRRGWFGRSRTRVLRFRLWNNRGWWSSSGGLNWDLCYLWFYD